MFLIIAVVGTILYGVTSAWMVINPYTMWEISRSGYQLSETEIKVMGKTATFWDKMKLMPKYISGAFIRPSMLLLYIIIGISVWVKH